LLFGAVRAVVSVVSFAAILWDLSGPLDIFGFQLSRAMFWIVVVFVAVATGVAFRLGRPLIWLSFNNEKLNAAFRYALVRLRDAAEAVGFYRGEQVERTQLWDRFTPVIGNYRRYVRRTIAFNGWNWSMSQAIVPLPWVVQAPRLFAGQIAFGDVTQTATAFGEISDSLSFFRNNYDAFAAFRAAIIRLHGLVDANDKGRDLPAVLTRPTDDGSVEFDGVEVRTPDGDPLVDSLDVRLESGQSLVITGQSGAGKTTLLRSLAELWPYASGTLRCPDGDNATMFLSQLPYVPLGSLRTVVCYPSRPWRSATKHLSRSCASGSQSRASTSASAAEPGKTPSPGESYSPTWLATLRWPISFRTKAPTPMPFWRDCSKVFKPRSTTPLTNLRAKSRSSFSRYLCL
jgi:putative ATP-binding cassette transporter